MALVRKTDKLKDSIIEKLDGAREAKTKAFLTGAKLAHKATKFLDTTFDEGLIVPSEDKDWAIGNSQAAYKDYNGYAPIEIECTIRRPVDGDNYKLLALMNFPDYSLMPVYKTPRFLYRNEDRNLHIALAAIEDYGGVKSGNRFDILITVPNLAERKSVDGKTIDFISIDKPKTTSNASGEFMYGPSHQMVGKGRAITVCKTGTYPVPNTILDQFLEFEKIRNDLATALARIDKSQQYIFAELWKLPSLNKMREFFPAITAFLPDETLAKLNQGASARKKEYNVSLPDDDVIVSATEASIKL